jgi:hypothetical protein
MKKINKEAKVVGKLCNGSRDFVEDGTAGGELKL